MTFVKHLLAGAMAASALSGAHVHTKIVRAEKKGWWEAVARYPVFVPSTPVLSYGTRLLDANADKLVAGFLKDAPTFIYNGKPQEPFAFDSSFAISIDKPNLLSLNLANYDDVGAAHPNTELQAFNIGLVHGKPKLLTLKDLFKPGPDPYKEMNEVLMARLRAKNLSFIEDGTVKSLTRDQMNGFVITPHGLDFLFSAYEVASYAEGPQDVELKFAEIKGLDPAGPLKGLFSQK